MKHVIAFSLLSGLFAVSNAFAQDGTIGGKITDEQGGVLPGVAITAVDTRTGLARSGTTNASGLYSFRALPPSTYTLTAELAGFATYIRENLILITGDAELAKLAAGLRFTVHLITTGAAPATRKGRIIPHRDLADLGDSLLAGP